MLEETIRVRGLTLLPGQGMEGEGEREKEKERERKRKRENDSYRIKEDEGDHNIPDRNWSGRGSGSRIRRRACFVRQNIAIRRW